MPETPNETPRPSDDFLKKLKLLFVSLLAAAVLLTLLLIILHYNYEQPVAEAVSATADADGNYTVKLAAVGDISMSEMQLKDFSQADGTLDCSGCFAGVFAQIASADIAVGNFEGTVASGAVDADNSIYPAAFVTALRDVGFDILQTANTQCLQDGVSGLEATLQAMRDNGIEPLGTFSSQQDRQEHNVLIQTVNGIRFAFIAFTKGMNNMRQPEGAEYSVNLLYTDYDTNYSKIDEDTIVSTIDAAKKANPDVIIAMLHWGSEYDDAVTDSQEKIADLMLDNGVNVILGSHTHVVSQMKEKSVSTLLGTVKKTFVAYSLGDFLTVSDKEQAKYGCILNLTFTKNASSGKTVISDASYTPTYCAVPSTTLDVSHYTVFDLLNEIRLYNNKYYRSVNKALYDELVDSLENLKDQTNIKYMVQK